MDALLDKDLASVPLVVIDTETTGLSPALGHRVVEVAAVRLEGWREGDRLDALVNPGRPMDPGASRVNGIYDDDLIDAPPFSEIADELSMLFDGALLVAHNAPFDAAFLGMEFGLLQSLNSEARPLPIPPNAWLCTLQLARRFFSFQRNSLSAVAHGLGLRSGRAHRALSDVYTTIGVLKRMSQQLRNMRLETVGDLLHAQGGPIFTPQHAQPPMPRRLVGPLSEALVKRCSLRIRYQTQRGETDRIISPLYATEEGGRGYIVAFCHLRQAQRTFRLDRIVQASVVE